MLGSLTRPDDGRHQLTFTRTLAHPREKVWRAVTENEHLATWFPDGPVIGDRAAGAALRFATAAGADGPPEFDGEVLAFDPPRRFAFRWGTDTISIELDEADDGRATVLTLVDTFAELGKAARDGAGWHDCVDLLVHHLDGDEPDRPAPQRWRELHERYIEALGADAATIGVPPG